MSGWILSKEEIEDFTGYSQPSKQLDFFKKYNIPAIPKADGSLRVVRTWVEQAPFAAAANQPIKSSYQGAAPNFSNFGKNNG